VEKENCGSTRQARPPLLRLDIPLSAKERKERVAGIATLSAAADDGDVSSQVLLAWEYAQGIVIEADFGKAARLFDQAAASGNEDAQVNRARFLHLRSVPIGLTELRKFAQLGNLKAQFWLAVYYRSQHGILNQKRAAILYRRSRDQGFIGAGLGYIAVQTKLAPLHLKPILVTKALYQILKLVFTNRPDAEIDADYALLNRLKKR
jgi:TPR repeat protein